MEVWKGGRGCGLGEGEDMIGSPRRGKQTGNCKVMDLFWE